MRNVGDIWEQACRRLNWNGGTDVEVKFRVREHLYVTYLLQ